MGTIPGLQEAGEGAASRTGLVTASCRGSVFCREEKTCFSCQKGSGVLCVAAAASLQFSLHISQQECPGWRFLGLPGCFLPCTAFAEVLTAACPYWSLPPPGKEVFLGVESPVGEGSAVAQLLDEQMQFRGKKEN